jgi:hypothetical protein
MRVRAHVRLIAAVWLSCQVVAFAAAPFVLCHDHNVMSQTGAGHECDTSHHHHGDAAPAPSAHEHHHQHTSEAPTSTTSNDAALNCRCTLSDAALAALILETAVIPGEFVVETTLVAMPVVLADRAAPTRVQQIDTPPPRA